MRKLLICALLISAAGAVSAQERKDNPFKSKRWWLETAAVTAAAIFDAEGHLQVQKACAYCTEPNGIFGSSRPSRKRFYLIGGSFVAGERLLAAAIWNKPGGKTVSSLMTVTHAGLSVAWGIDNRKDAAYYRRRACPANGAGCS